MKYFSRLIIFCLGFYWIEYDEPEEEPSKPYIIISNHLSFIDIFIHMSINQGTFVARKGVSDFFLIGSASKKLQMLSVDRDSQDSKRNILKNIKAHLETSDYPLHIYPESTVCKENYLLTFKKGAFVNRNHLKVQVLNFKSDIECF